MTTYLIVNRETKAVVKDRRTPYICWQFRTVAEAKSVITRMKKKVAEDHITGKWTPNWCLDVEKYDIYNLDLDTMIGR